MHVLHGVGIFDGLKIRGAGGCEKEYIKILQNLHKFGTNSEEKILLANSSFYKFLK